MAEAASAFSVVVAYSPGPRQVLEWPVVLPAGATLAQALSASALFTEYPALRSDVLDVSVWGRAATLQQTLREGDRVEVLRGLRVDPKVARRERFKRQGARSTGLFARGPKRGPQG
jgi:putative ubiquitin-RnfH superfamily antitoxin RatB of RatAB toxin-antitoxin module